MKLTTPISVFCVATMLGGCGGMQSASEWMFGPANPYGDDSFVDTESSSQMTEGMGSNARFHMNNSLISSFNAACQTTPVGAACTPEMRNAIMAAYVLASNQYCNAKLNLIGAPEGGLDANLKTVQIGSGLLAAILNPSGTTTGFASISVASDSLRNMFQSDVFNRSLTWSMAADTVAERRALYYDLSLKMKASIVSYDDRQMWIDLDNYGESCSYTAVQTRLLDKVNGKPLPIEQLRIRLEILDRVADDLNTELSGANSRLKAIGKPSTSAQVTQVASLNQQVSNDQGLLKKISTARDTINGQIVTQLSN